MGNDYIPRGDAEFNAWQANFVTYANANLVNLGLVIGDLTTILNRSALGEEKGKGEKGGKGDILLFRGIRGFREGDSQVCCNPSGESQSSTLSTETERQGVTSLSPNGGGLALLGVPLLLSSGRS
ncbi:MAG: hypothetical protein AAB341_00555 [Planctomycetota bacterium]